MHAPALGSRHQVGRESDRIEGGLGPEGLVAGDGDLEAAFAEPRNGWTNIRVEVGNVEALGLPGSTTGCAGLGKVEAGTRGKAES